MFFKEPPFSREKRADMRCPLFSSFSLVVLFFFLFFFHGTEADDDLQMDHSDPPSTPGQEKNFLPPLFSAGPPETPILPFPPSAFDDDRVPPDVPLAHPSRARIPPTAVTVSGNFPQPFQVERTLTCFQHRMVCTSDAAMPPFSSVFVFAPRALVPRVRKKKKLFPPSPPTPPPDRRRRPSPSLLGKWTFLFHV